MALMQNSLVNNFLSSVTGNTNKAYILLNKNPNASREDPIGAAASGMAVHRPRNTRACAVNGPGMRVNLGERYQPVGDRRQHRPLPHVAVVHGYGAPI